MEPISEKLDMKHIPADFIDIEDDAQVLRAMQLAVADALRSHKEKGQYVVSSVDGKPVIIQPEDIIVPEIID